LEILEKKKDETGTAKHPQCSKSRQVGGREKKKRPPSRPEGKRGRKNKKLKKVRVIAKAAVYNRRSGRKYLISSKPGTIGPRAESQAQPREIGAT